MTDRSPSPLVVHRMPVGRWTGLALAGVLIAGLGACADSPRVRSIKDTKIPGVYRLAIQQGNVLEAEAVSKLEIGMTKRKVSYLVGTPAIRDTFNQDRWDYVYTYQPGGGEREQRSIALVFENEKLARIDGHLPEDSGRAVSVPKSQVVDVPPESRKRSFVSTINPWSDEGKVVKKKKPAADAPSEDAPAERPAEFETPPAPEGSQANASAATSDAQAPGAASEQRAASDDEGEGERSLFDRLSERFNLSAPDDQGEPVPADR